MNSEYWIWFLLIFASDICAAIVFYFGQKWLKKSPNIGCENCGKPRVTKKSWDKKFWLCRSCMKIYRLENPIVKSQ